MTKHEFEARDGTSDLKKLYCKGKLTSNWLVMFAFKRENSKYAISRHIKCMKEEAPVPKGWLNSWLQRTISETVHESVGETLSCASLLLNELLHIFIGGELVDVLVLSAGSVQVMCTTDGPTLNAPST